MISATARDGESRAPLEGMNCSGLGSSVVRLHSFMFYILVKCYAKFPPYEPLSGLRLSAGSKSQKLGSITFALGQGTAFYEYPKLVG